jgi:thiamine transport system ATP-binding protein
VALARSLAPSPRLLLLDEPLGALDRPLRERLVGDLRRIVTELGLTVVAVTHDHDEAFALSDRVALMDHGTVLQVGPPAAVWQQPTSRRVAEVLGLPNLLAVTVRSGRATGPWGSVPVGGPDGPATLHLPRQALRVDGAGSLEGIAGAVTFRGDSTELRVELVGGAVLDVLVAPPAPEPGTVVRLSVDPAAMVRLDR